MAKSMIPLRPEGFAVSGLTQEEQDCVTWFVLSGRSQRDCFVTFARPDMLESKAKAALDDYVKGFFARKEVRAYIEAYRETLVNFTNPEKKDEKELPLEQRMVLSRKKILEFTMTLIDNIEEAKDPEQVLKMADKLGMIDEEDDKIEEPRRFLPEQCGHCAYRQFCEENAEDMCPHCKYYKYGEQNGIHFEKEKMLDIQLNSTSNE